MVKGRTVLVPLMVVATIVAPVVAFGLDADNDVHFVPDSPAPTDVPDAPVQDAVPPAILLFTGMITFSDPTGEAMGPDPILWGEACHILGLGEGHYQRATLSLVDGVSGGKVEDLDLYGWDAGGERLFSQEDNTTQVGVHHQADLDRDVAKLGVCLAGGLRGSYELVVG